MRSLHAVVVLMLLVTMTASQEPTPRRIEVGPQGAGRHVITTGQLIAPAGETLPFGGRPVDIANTPDGQTLLAKDNRGLVVVHVPTWTLTQELAFDKDFGGSMHGIVVSRDGKRAWLTTAQNRLYEAERGDDDRWAWKRWIVLHGPKIVLPGYKNETDDSHSCGITLAGDEKTAFVCLSRNNSLAEVDLTEGTLKRTIPVGVAPYDVLLVDEGRKAIVSNWGGRRARSDDRTEPSSGTPVVVDARGVASSGTVMWVDLASGSAIAEIETGLHPSDLVLSPDGKQVFVANSNSDTVAVLDVAQPQLVERFELRPQAGMPFGSTPNALAVSDDGKRLYVALARNNAVAVVDLPGDYSQGDPQLAGVIPTGWYPGGLVLNGPTLFVANVKGIGSRREKDGPGKFNSHGHMGSLSRVEIPSPEQLAVHTKQVSELGRGAEIVDAMQAGAGASVKPVPLPLRPGEPSLIEHVVYVIKENRTYDQVFGDLPQGKGKTELCIFGRKITPNHHALAEQFVLLDNFYCNGVLSADGHSWATEGNVTDHLEKSFGGFTRSYTFGDDPLTYSSTGFLWDGVLARGQNVRNYGEMDNAELDPPKATFLEVFRDWQAGTGKIKSRRSIGIATLRERSCPDYPGWNLNIPDQLRVDVFLRELKEFEKQGQFPSLTLVHLPQDHTSGTSPDNPTPAACVADNDLALGRLVEGLSHSRFWPKTCIFVVEDDPQDGFDHVDGHRTVALVISPYSCGRGVVSDFYNQTAMLHTMELILGLPPMNQMDALATPMRACFAAKPDPQPYEALAANVALDEMNPPMASLKGRQLELAELSDAQPLEQLDAADEDTFNRILWHAMRGVDARYPAEYAGAHGRGLAERGLSVVEIAENEEEELDAAKEGNSAAGKEQR